MDSDGGSVTTWLHHLRSGQGDAAQRLWERYFPELVRLARRKLRDTSRRVADEEDAALSAFDSFCRGAAGGRFPRLDDRDDLWQVLVMLTARKVLHFRRDEGRLKRGGGKVLDQAACTPTDDSPDPLAEVIGTEPTPEFAAQVSEEYERLLTKLESEELKTVAQLRLEGYTAAEIADRLSCVPRTVERKLGLIRKIWQADQGDGPATLQREADL
jgi:DNA-directed RNA polymerase specialized sigma24 family protein